MLPGFRTIGDISGVESFFLHNPCLPAQQHDVRVARHPLLSGVHIGYYRSFDVTPDGERFLVVLPAERTEVDAPQPRIIIVQNWFEELRRLVPTA